MIDYAKKVLDNGLTVLAHTDTSTPMAAVNILYKVGARNEDPSHTGFAHLFEHLMFAGSRNVPDFDGPIQMTSGENNAFTNNDYTNYYIAIPKVNIETALWAESDRMRGLNIEQGSLDVQRKVVVQEFAQRYLNQPYGDIWLLLRPLAYKVHPYQWATIGKCVEHITDSTLDQVRSFYDRYYTPSNAILSIGADMSHDEIFRLAEKWFGDIEALPAPIDTIPQEPKQTEQRRLTVERDVPVSVIYMAFHMGDRLSREYQVCDVMSDILSNGTSSRLYQRLVKDRKLFSSVNAYISGDMDNGLFIVTGRIISGSDMKECEDALWEQLEILKEELVSKTELNKVKNKFEATNIFSQINVLNKAMNLAYFEMLSSAEMINQEVRDHASVEAGEIKKYATKIFTPENSSILHYMARNKSDDEQIQD